MDYNELKINIIRPALQPLNLWSDEVEDLLVAIYAQSIPWQLTMLTVDNPEPYHGPFKMNTETHDLLWKTKLSRLEGFVQTNKMLRLFNLSRPPKAFEMNWHFGYATFMAAFYNSLSMLAFPKYLDIDGQYFFYKAHWLNGQYEVTEQEFLDNVKKFVKKGKKR